MRVANTRHIQQNCWHNCPPHTLLEQHSVSRRFHSKQYNATLNVPLNTLIFYLCIYIDHRIQRTQTIIACGTHTIQRTIHNFKARNASRMNRSTSGCAKVLIQTISFASSFLFYTSFGRPHRNASLWVLCSSRSDIIHFIVLFYVLSLAIVDHVCHRHQYTIV